MEPESIDDILHDLGAAARFGVGVQIKSDGLMDLLIERGESGILGYLSLGWDEGRYYGGGFYPTVQFRRKLQALSNSPPHGNPKSIFADFDLLLNPGELEELNQAYREFEALPFRRKRPPFCASSCSPVALTCSSSPSRSRQPSSTRNRTTCF